jgi:hypothetical protein
MSATNTLEDGLLSLIFTATTLDGLAENDTSSPYTNLYISLHTGDPGEAGSQTSSETAYTGYARVAVARTTDGWTIASGTATNDAEIAFPICTASPGGNLTHVGIGSASSGAGVLLLSDALSSSIAMQIGTTPIFSAGELDITCS